MTDRQTDRQTDTKRIYGLDLYKILAMFFVVVFHFSFHGNVDITCAQKLTFNWTVLAVARIFGAVGNAAFMLISGYFLCRKKFSFKTVFRLWLEVWFYAVLLGSVRQILGREPFSLKSLFSMFFPFIMNQYWFFSTYLVIYLIFPFLNRCIDGLSEKQHRAAVALGFILVPLLTTFAGARWIIGTNRIVIFIVLYFTGAYFCRYDVGEGIHQKRKAALLSAGCLALEIASLFGMRIFYALTGRDYLFYFVWDVNKILPVLTGIALFLFFKQVRVRHIGILSFLASSVFGVYLFHDGPLQTFLFGTLFDNSATYGTTLLLPQMAFAACAIFAVGILIDKIRILIFERPVLKLLRPIIDRIDERCAAVWREDA